MKKTQIVAILLATLCLFTACGATGFESATPTTKPDDTTPESPLTTEDTSILETPAAPEMDRYVEMLALDARKDFFYEKGTNDEFVYLTYSYTPKEMYFVIIKEYTGSSPSVTIPDSLEGSPVVGFYHNMFEQCSFVEDISFPDTLRTVIMSSSAESDICLDNTKWYHNQPDGIYYAGNIAVGYKGDIPTDTVLTFREGTIGIGGGAFFSQDNITGIQIPESMIIIGRHAFQYAGLTELHIPGTMMLFDHAFNSCRALTSVSFGEGIETIYAAFSGCSALSQLSLPSTLVTIEDCAFIDCESLLSVQLPDSTKTIGERAFQGAGLIEVSLNEGLSYIKDEAFDGCVSLQSVYIPGSVDSFGSIPFGYNNEKLIDGFVAVFEKECSFKDHLEDKGITCRIGTRESVQ
ncbi:MAG: leucine-rich repeat domain-containing protein [Oscillospiraceae bacterium]|nr:leucine-rich repeat domain-containing protein [Oscillospiraceae bacterium]